MMESKGRSVLDTPFVGYAGGVLGDTFRSPDGAARECAPEDILWFPSPRTPLDYPKEP
jgi:hypothetical protein